jgi:hypothetical protein
MQDDEIDKIESLEVERWFDEHGDGFFGLRCFELGMRLKRKI